MFGIPPTPFPTSGKIFAKYSDDDARDAHGEWTAGGEVSSDAKVLDEKTKQIIAEM